MSASTYRKKPVEIKAMQWPGDVHSAIGIIDWILREEGVARYVHFGEEHPLRYPSELYPHNDEGTRPVAKDAPAFIVIDTLVGAHRMNPNDWAIKGVAGEFYPCKPDIFAQTYDLGEHRAEFRPGEVGYVLLEALEAEQQRATEAVAADRLMDLHARYHDQPGNMLGRDECGWERCEFWDAASFALAAPATEEGSDRG